MELYAALSFRKPIVFQCRAIQAVAKGDNAAAAAAAAATLTLTDVGLTFNMLLNFSFMVDVTNAACAVEADRIREMATIGEENIPRLNKAVSAALMAGSTAANGDCASAVDACLCGEPEAMRSLTSAKEVIAALDAACAAGHMAVVKELLDTRRRDIGDLSTQYYPLFIGTWTTNYPTARSPNTRTLQHPTAPPPEHPDAPTPPTPPNTLNAPQHPNVPTSQRLNVPTRQRNPPPRQPTSASMNGHLDVVRYLLEDEIEGGEGATREGCVSVDTVESSGATDAQTPLIIASWAGHTDIVRLLLEKNADRTKTDRNLVSALFMVIVLPYPSLTPTLPSPHSSYQLRTTSTPVSTIIVPQSQS